MRINDGYPAGARIDWQQGIDPAQSPAPAARSDSAAAAASDDSSASELAQLVAAATATDEVRPDVVREVSARLAAGAYSTREAAEQTADAILRG